MFTRVKNIVKNNWKKVAVGAIGAQVVMYGVKYAAGKFLAYHEAQALELWTKLQKEQHFERMESTFKVSFLGLVTNLRETLIVSLDSEVLLTQLKQLRSTDVETTKKLEVWDKLKVVTFSKIIAYIYGSSLLNVLLRIQLNVIGGYLYLESDEDEQKHEWRNVNGIILSNNTAIDTELQQKYLSLASYLVNAGMQNLCSLVFEQTAAVVGSIGLKQKLTISDLEGIFMNIVRGVNRDAAVLNGCHDSCNSPVKYPWKYIFTPDILESQDYFRNTLQKCRPHYEPPDIYERLLTETFDLIDSDDVVGLLNSFEHQGISHFCDRVTDFIIQETTEESTTAGGGDDQPPVIVNDIPHLFSEVQIPMAKIIPMLNSLATQSNNNTDPWLSVLMNSESTRTFAANVYESFSQSLY